MYLAIRSVSTTNSVDMFTLGVSTARGTNKIGQFGSGSLMGVLLWLRTFAESPVFMLNGSRVEFYSVPERMSNKGVFHRVYMVENGVKTPLSVSLDYGTVDWTNAEMSLREWISNAIDQGADITESLSVVDSIEASDNEVAVFVPFNSTCQKYWQEIDKHFLHFTKRETAAAIEKEAVSKCRVYRRGVLIRQLDEDSIFDYNLDFDINESRNGSSDSMTSLIVDQVQATCETKLTDDQRKTILSHVLNSTKCLEVRCDSWRERLGARWKTVIDAVATNVRFSTPGARAENAVPIPAKWYNMIVKLCPERDGLINMGHAAKEGFDIVKTPEETTKLVDMLWSTIVGLNLHNKKEKPQVEVFKTKNGQQPGFYGKYSKGVISIWQDHAASKQTILEELCHHASGCDDCTRAFQEYLFRLSIELINVVA